uniref:Uncharacterized protein LOC111132812 isoform X2 n=1 Tax=Crassostrea virginica TaxID=6565 RepID=A0A8B8E9V2_CRAVI|nr:uncharacterized protein LOC111132812 isoform X2 [Crassostrea virginica]
MMSNTLLFYGVSFICVGHLFLLIETCNYPSDLQSAVWEDSQKGSLTYTTNQMTGYTYSSYSSGSSIWNCFLIDGDYVVSKATGTINLFSAQYDVYICQKFTKITSFSYSYYLESDVQSNANNDRLNVFPTGNSVTVSQACAKTMDIPTEEFHVLVKNSNIADVKQWFPTPLLGKFEYTKVTAAGVSSCGSGSVWDDCTNRTTMSINMTQCSSVVAFSQGVTYCVTYITKGSTYYVVVVNPGIADGTTYFRFACLAVSQSGSTVTVVEKSGSCGAGQNTSLAGTGGSKYTMTPYETCPFTTDSPSEPSSDIGLIIGIVVALLVLLAIAAVVGYCIYKKKKNQIYDKEKKENANYPEYPHRGYTNLPESFSPTLTSKPETAVNGNTPDLQKPAQT